jgi:predicted nucleic acid-binding protein
LIGSRVAYDTNILVYLQGVQNHPDDAAKIEAVRLLHRNLAKTCACVAPQQALGELYSVLVRDTRDRELARERLLRSLNEFDAIAATVETFVDAIDLATEHKLQFWDALIIATAAVGGCSLLLSEDMQNGFAWRGVTVVNPFEKKMHKRLARVLADADQPL